MGWIRKDFFSVIPAAGAFTKFEYSAKLLVKRSRKVLEKNHEDFLIPPVRSFIVVKRKARVVVSSFVK